MLRITVKENPEKTVLRLEGKLAGPYVDELERCCEAEAAQHHQVAINLAEVSYIDARGRQALAELHARGAELTAAGLSTCAVVEQITGACSEKANGRDAHDKT